MKKIIFAISIFFFISTNVSPSGELHQEELPPQKNIILNMGYGNLGFNFGFGFRYWLLGLSIGATGLSEDIPGYGTNIQFRPKGDDYITENFPTLLVSGDLNLYYDISDSFTAFGGVGYYAQADSVLAYYPGHDEWWEHETDNKSGIAFGAGIQYFFRENFNLGIAYHTKLGFYAQFGYWWF